MPSVIQSDWAKAKKSAPYARAAGGVVAMRFNIAATAAQLALNNIFELCPIPVGHRPLDLILDADDLDSNVSPLVTLDVGIMSGEFGTPDDARTCGAEFIAASTVGQAGGAVRPSLKGAFRVASNQTVRSIGVKVAAAPATAAAGEIGLTVIFAPD